MEEIKVCFRQLKAGTGADVWTYNTLEGLKGYPVKGILDFYDKKYMLYPYLINPNKVGDYDIAQGDIVYGYKFKDKRPLVIIEQHMISDPIVKKYENILQKLHRKLLERYEKKSIDAADIIICSSKSTERGLKKIFGDHYNTKVIYGGVDNELFKPFKVDKQTDKIVLLFVGNPINRKGFDLLPKIMEQLDDGFEIWYTSDKTFFDDKRIKPIGRFKPNSQELVELHNKADIFLFPTRLEGFGLCVAEAMACGKPVITTNYSSLPELIVNEKGGYLCEMDDVNDFVEKIKILAKDENLRKDMGKFNKERVDEKFSIKRLGENYYKLYKELI